MWQKASYYWSARTVLVTAFAAPAMMMLAPSSSTAATILVAQCSAGAACTTAPTPTPWSNTLTLADLTAIGLGTSQPFIATQTGPGFLRLGPTNITFDTSGSPITESFPQFNGTQQQPPCNPCLVATLGSFSIPSNAVSAMISGTFGNSLVPTTAPVDLSLSATAPSEIPLPAALPLFGTGLGALGLLGWRRKRHALAVA